jgi:CHASE2 domain-containing sensor protein
MTIVAGTFVLRAAAGWSSVLGFVGNLVSSVVLGLYDRARRSGQPFRFHLAIETGWDGGAVAACRACAAVAHALPHAPSMAVLPGILGVAVLYWCLKHEYVGRHEGVISSAA